MGDRDRDGDVDGYYDLLDAAKEQFDAVEDDAALRIFDEVSEELAIAKDSDLRALAAFALYEKSFALRDRGRFDEILSTTAVILARYEDAPERDIQFYVAATLLLQGERLVRRHKSPIQPRLTPLWS